MESPELGTALRCGLGSAQHTGTIPALTLPGTQLLIHIARLRNTLYFFLAFLTDRLRRGYGGDPTLPAGGVGPAATRGLVRDRSVPGVLSLPQPRRELGGDCAAGTALPSPGTALPAAGTALPALGPPSCPWPSLRGAGPAVVFRVGRERCRCAAGPGRDSEAPPPP